MGYFKLLKKTKIQEITENTHLPESDYCVSIDGELIQFTYIEEDKSVRGQYEVGPGVFTIVKTQMGYQLDKTSFVKDEILESFVNTVEIEKCVDTFFNNLNIYKEFGIEIPKRGVILYGIPGSGKSTALNKSVNKYASDGKTAVVVWSSYKYEAFEVKDFIQTFKYVDGVEKIILVVEDLGGIENEQTRLRADSSLLSLLDNQEKTFTIPVMIIATTNYPENLAESIMNRPGRFDDKLRIDAPPANARVELLKFFTKGTADQESIDFVKTDKAKEFTPAVLREAYIRSKLRDETLFETLKKLYVESEEYKKAYSKSGKFGL